MDKEDARKQSLEQLHERRKQVVRLHKRKLGIMQIVELSGLSYPTVRNTIKLFEAGGWPAIKPAARGHKHGEGRRLSADQEAAIRRIICDSRPEQLKMDFYLWSRAAVGGHAATGFGPDSLVKLLRKRQQVLFSLGDGAPVVEPTFTGACERDSGVQRLGVGEVQVQARRDAWVQ